MKVKRWRCRLQRVGDGCILNSENLTVVSGTLGGFAISLASLILRATRGLDDGCITENKADIFCIV